MSSNIYISNDVCLRNNVLRKKIFGGNDKRHKSDEIYTSLSAYGMTG